MAPHAPQRPPSTRRPYVRHPKPPQSYVELIGEALQSSPSGALTLGGITRYLGRHYPFFRGQYQGWKNSVRHNLSLNQCFRKILRDPRRPYGKDNLWTVEPRFLPAPRRHFSTTTTTTTTTPSSRNPAPELSSPRKREMLQEFEGREMPDSLFKSSVICNANPEFAGDHNESSGTYMNYEDFRDKTQNSYIDKPSRSNIFRFFKNGKPSDQYQHPKSLFPSTSPSNGFSLVPPCSSPIPPIPSRVPSRPSHTHHSTSIFSSILTSESLIGDTKARTEVSYTNLSTLHSYFPYFVPHNKPSTEATEPQEQYTKRREINTENIYISEHVPQCNEKLAKGNTTCIPQTLAYATVHNSNSTLYRVHKMGFQLPLFLTPIQTIFHDPHYDSVNIHSKGYHDPDSRFSYSGNAILSGKTSVKAKQVDIHSASNILNINQQNLNELTDHNPIATNKVKKILNETNALVLVDNASCSGSVINNNTCLKFGIEKILRKEQGNARINMVNL